jgi:cytochrome c-type biogenesis protein
MSQSVSILTAFVAGMLSFLSPCVLPLIPAYLSYISGLSMEELKHEGGLPPASRRRILFRSLLFVAGFTFVFVVLGATATALGKLFLSWMNVLMRIAGVLIILFGLHTAGWLKIPFLYYEKRFRIETKVTSLLSVFVMGAAFAFGWTPCVGPILAAILTQAARQETIWSGILLLTVYSVGLGLPFVLAGLALSRFFGFLGRMKKHYRTVEIVSGLLLIVVGLLVVVGRLSDIASFFIRIFPSLGSIG